MTYGVVNYINNKEIIFSSYRNLFNNCWPIFNLSTNKLIGIYENTSKYYNKGIYLKYLINEFIIKYKEKNEIDIILNIDEKDINKEIYFLNDYYDNVKLNEFNTELYINNRKK